MQKSESVTTFDVRKEAKQLCEASTGDCCSGDDDKPPCDETNCMFFCTVKAAYVSGYQRGVEDGHGDLV